MPHRNFHHFFLSFDIFSTQLSLIPVATGSKKTWQYHGSWFGFLLTMVLGAFTASYGIYLILRMTSFLDDRYTSLKQTNTFQNGINHFWISEFNFMASYQVGLTLGQESADQLLESGIDIFQEGNS